MTDTPASRYYLTAAIPYVNAKPHLGHVLEWFQADAIARYQRLLGKEVQFTCGSDENSLKNVQAAEKAGQETQVFLDTYSAIFEEAFKSFDISLTGFRRGSDQVHHFPGVQKLWQLCDQSGDIYTKRYQGLYCVGCESFYAPEDLVDGRCPEHPNTEPELVEEENYFFRLSKYADQIRDLLNSGTVRVVSDQFKNEMLGFLDQGLEDISISRSQARARGVGVPVPGDDSQRMYVWFDALSIYLTSIGWGYDEQLWSTFWPADVHVIGKGINRFHSIYWLGMLLSAGLALPRAITVHGYMTADGQKMSKSIGNVIDPFEAVNQYGLEPIRYYLLKAIPSHADGDFSVDRFKELYTADLANAIGNVCSRVAALVAKNIADADLAEQLASVVDTFSGTVAADPQSLFSTEYRAAMEDFELSQALQLVIEEVSALDKYLSEQKPWTLEGAARASVLASAVERILTFAWQLQPFLPQTSQKILTHFTTSPDSKLEPLFPRLSE